jgi:hypothetical protein
MKQQTKPASDCQVRRRIFGRLLLGLSDGGWWCLDCEKQTERIEGEQGLPAHCERCLSHRIQYQPPLTRIPYGKTVPSSSEP